MADPDEEDKIGNVNAPENLSRKPCDRQAGSILSDICIKSEEDEGAEDGNGDVEPLPALRNMFKENGVFSDDLPSLVQHNRPNTRLSLSSSPPKREEGCLPAGRQGVRGL